jgi:hypothetical protein
MEDVIPSEVIYYYPFKKAIDEGYICDYKIYLPFIQNNKIMINIPSELYHLDENLCKKCLFFANGLLKTGSRRPIVYLKSIEECVLYKNILEEIMSKYHYYNVKIDIITCNTEKNDRNKILKDFETIEDYEVIKCLLSIRILNEGVNFILCDSIFLTSLGDIYNDIVNTQRMLRAVRLNNYNVNKIAHIFIWCEDNNIALYRNAVIKLAKILKLRVMDTAKPSMFYFPEFSGLRSVVVPSGFLEETVYSAVFLYCNFDVNLPIPEIYKTIVVEKPAGYNSNWSIQEKI